MGKIYDALKKAEIEGHPAGWSSIAVEDSPARATTNGKKNGAPQR